MLFVFLQPGTLNPEPLNLVNGLSIKSTKQGQLKNALNILLEFSDFGFILNAEKLCQQNHQEKLDDIHHFLKRYLQEVHFGSG